MREKCGRDRQVKDSNIVLQMGVTFLITNATYTQSEYVIFQSFLR